MARKTAPKEQAPTSVELSEAILARQRAEERLAEVQGFWPEVRAVAESFRKLRTENHFAERMKGAH